jgi:NTP pyrophosphatase (non-canonical NTP hydrolase)
MSEFSEIRDKARQFALDRDWDQFHSPKNLTMALSSEVAELIELFQWLSEEQSRNLSAEQKQAAAHEIADVQIYLIRLADKLGVDIPGAVSEKMAINEQRYPAEQARGSAKKYTAYQSGGSTE